MTVKIVTAVIVWAVLPVAIPNAAAQTHVWARWEHALHSARAYAHPCRDVALRVTYTGPKGQTLRAYGFWDGGDVYRLRCAFPAPGRWRWRTECSDTANTGLHDRSGEVSVTAYRGRNPLYRHGFLRVSPNGRYLCHADGTPFLWMGDTAWAVPFRATFADWETYLANRVRKRFTVIQVAIAPWWAGDADAQGNRPFVGEGITQPNPAFWQAYERKIQRANEQGLAIMLVGVMEPTTRYPKAEEARAFARELAARLYGNFVMFSPSFDSGYMPLGDAVGEALREATGAHLITQHPGTPSGQPVNVIAEAYRDKPYLDFAGDQTGHNGGNRVLCARQALRWNLSLWRRLPPKPVINLEAMYDAQGIDIYTADDARSLAWRSWLSGAKGYTYGAGDSPPKVPAMDGGIWRWITDPAKPDYWRKAMDWTSSDQMTILRDFLADIPWWRLEPAHEMVRNQPPDDRRRMPLARTAEGDVAVAYLPDNEEIEVDLSALRLPLTARWFDPVAGRFMPGSERVADGDTRRFRAPRRGEWVLLLRSADRPSR